MSSRKQAIKKSLEYAFTIGVSFMGLSVLLDAFFGGEITLDELVHTSYLGVIVATVIFIIEYRKHKREKQMQESIAQDSEKDSQGPQK